MVNGFSIFIVDNRINYLKNPTLINVARKALQYKFIYRLYKKIPPFNFFNNFHKFLYFFTKFGIQVAKRFLHMYGKFHDYSISIGGVTGISKKLLKILSDRH